MRLRNIPRAREVIQAHKAVVREAEKQKGRWQEVFGNTAPLHIESGGASGNQLYRDRALLQRTFARSGEVRYTAV